MTTYKLKIGDCICDLSYSEKNNGILIIFCQGFPGSFKYESFAQSFVSKGFLFMHPKYIGSWESLGKFSVRGCRKTIEDIINFPIENIKDIFGKKIEIKIKKIYLVGHSFGGSLALSLSSNKKISGIVALSPIIDFRTHNDSGNESDLFSLFNYVNKGLPGLFRGLNEKDWNNFCISGYNMNPIDFFEELKDKKIFLGHGDKDHSVDFNKTEKFYLKLKKFNKNVKFFKASNCDHSEIREKSANKIIQWINSN